MSRTQNNILATLRLQSSLDDVSCPSFWKALLAECLGTFILVFIGLGSCYGDGKLVAAALAFGVGGAVSIYMVAPISGGHINPAVSFGLLIARKISLFRFILYSMFQCVGAVLGAWLISFMTFDAYKTVNGLSTASVSPINAFICEIIITFVLVFTVMRLCVEKSRSDLERALAALMIGFSIMVGILCGANISGGSMNPARSIGPAVTSSQYGNIWIYLAGPLIGGALAGLLQQLVFTSALSKEHLVSYLISANFEMDNDEDTKEKRDKDLESNGSSEKKSIQKINKSSPKKSAEELELLENS